MRSRRLAKCGSERPLPHTGILFRNFVNQIYVTVRAAVNPGLWIPQIPSVTNAIEISDTRKGTGGWVKKATGK
jgi:hypothetical protein